ncbi:IclR family transcriptional regulator [Novosphingobium sp. M1R2S20]|uniref:IclR family transcriptional regulator n=1 Tax=Novosphingobium rhizovicinum TaxID=3228928 RepID=A0ABV3RA95_9SPHN
MAVKRSQSAGRMLQVFEAVAAQQPVGVSALARKLDADKSAVQRDLMTLADAGWIRTAPGQLGQWELTPRILTLAHTPHSQNELRLRVRPALEALRAETGETAYLTVPDGDQFVVIDALESPQALRLVTPVGLVIPARGSATVRALLPYLCPEEQQVLLGGPPDAAALEQFAAVRKRGYALNDGAIVPEAIALASAVLGADERPIGAIVLTGPAERIAPERIPVLGSRLAAATRALAPAVAA